MIESGKRVYFTKCVWCHGVDGAGDGPVRSAVVARNSQPGVLQNLSHKSENCRCLTTNEEDLDTGRTIYPIR
ncbi:MAG: cytochrome c [Nitrospira sp.]|nr:cytochrome c [Nitrospira sp.]